jgi:hypothetical protein
MPAHLTPGSPYHGWSRKYRKNPPYENMNKPGPKRRRVCFYVMEDLAAWLAIWAGSVRASQSRVIEEQLKRLRREEDPDNSGAFPR